MNYHDFEYYGAHQIQNNSYVFRVFAPSAETVSIYGDFTNQTPISMKQNSNGVWEIVLPAKEYQKYQYIINTFDNQILTKIDPYSRTCRGGWP